MRIKPVALLIASLALAGAGCFGRSAPPSGTGTNADTPQAFGSSVTLSVGQSVTYSDGLVVTLKEISDSRCPADVVCVWAGELSPLLNISGAGITDQEVRLGTTTAENTTAGVYAFSLKGATTASATIVVTKGSAAAQTSYKDLLRNVSVSKDMVIKSPLGLTGEARGNWYFEASFPVKLLDANGKVLFQGPAQAIGEWMTTEYVPFSITVPFPTPETATGTLVLEKDNPSGLPEHDDALRIPVKFSN